MSLLNRELRTSCRSRIAQFLFRPNCPTFGIFLKPMGAELHVNHAALSTVFSTATVISFFLSPSTGSIADGHGPRPVVAVGAVLMCAGLVATSRVRFFPLLFVTYGP